MREAGPYPAATLGRMETDVGAALTEAGAVTVDGVKRARAGGRAGIGNAERDTLREAVAALRRSVTSTVATFQSELTDVIDKYKGDNGNGGSKSSEKSKNKEEGEGRNHSSDGGSEDTDDDGGGSGGGAGAGAGGEGGPKRDGLIEVAVRLSSTAARLQQVVRVFEATVRAELDKQATELESTLTESAARVRTALGELEEILTSTARVAAGHSIIFTRCPSQT